MSRMFEQEQAHVFFVLNNGIVMGLLWDFMGFDGISMS